MSWTCHRGSAIEKHFKGWSYSLQDRECKTIFGDQRLIVHNRLDVGVYPRLREYSQLIQPRDIPTQYKPLELHGLHLLWFGIVPTYSKYNLTRIEDKPVALSGVVQRLQTATGLEYLAGLWRETLMWDLLWMTKYPREHRPPGYRAPTWSLASIDGKIDGSRTTRSPRWNHVSNDVPIEHLQPVLGIQSVIIATDPLDIHNTGKVRYASLSVEGTSSES